MNGIQIGMLIALIVFTTIGSASYIFVRKSGKRFIVAGKTMPLILAGTMLFAQSTDANSTFGTAGLAYSGGFWMGLTIPGGAAVALVLLGLFFAKPLNRMNLITFPDFYFRRYNNVVEILMCLISAFGFIIMVAGNLAGCGWILSWIFPITLVQGMLIVSAIVIIYTVAGGIFSCAATDIVQLYPAVIAFVGSVIWLINKVGFSQMVDSAPVEFFNLTSVTSIEGGSLLFWSGFLALAFGNILSLDYMERVFCAESPETASKACFWAAGFSILMGICSILIGLFGLTLIPNIANSNNIMPTLATDFLPFALGLFIMIGVVGAGLSTANGGLLATCSIFSRNLLQRNILKTKRQKMTDEERVKFDEWLLKATRIASIPIMLLAVLAAWWRPEPGILLILAFDVLLASCGVPLVLGIYWKKANTPGAIAAILVGSASRIIMHFITPESLVGIDTLLPPLFSLVAMFVVSLMTQKSSPSKHQVIYEIPDDDAVLSAER